MGIQLEIQWNFFTTDSVMHGVLMMRYTVFDIKYSILQTSNLRYNEVLLYIERHERYQVYSSAVGLNRCKKRSRSDDKY